MVDMFWRRTKTAGASSWKGKGRGREAVVRVEGEEIEEERDAGEGGKEGEEEGARDPRKGEGWKRGVCARPWRAEVYDVKYEVRRPSLPSPPCPFLSIVYYYFHEG